MDSLNKAQKLVKILELMHRRGGVQAQELVERFDVDPRTLRRYLADLKDLGLPIQDEGAGPERVVALDSTYRRSGVQLSLAEVLSLHFGRKLFNFLEGTPFATDLDDAIERLEPAIARTHAELAGQLDRKFFAVPENTKDYREHGDLVDEVVSALVYDAPLRATYRKVRGLSRRYELEPLTLATWRQGLYLFARDRADGRIKTFALERFVEATRVRGERFQPPPGYDPAQVVADAFGIMGGEPQDVVATFDASVAYFIRERRWHRTQRLETLPDGRVRMRLRVVVGEELVSWLASYAGDVVVEHPPELVARLRNAWARALERNR